MSGLAKDRLAQERKMWRKDHPPGFVAKPRKKENGDMNLFEWDCAVPGREGTKWGKAMFPVVIKFGDQYPAQPPKVQFDAGFFHPNVYPSGTVCLSILDVDKDWRPTISVKQILVGVQDLLENPNPNSPAQQDAYTLYTTNQAEYYRRVQIQTAKYIKLSQK